MNWNDIKAIAKRGIAQKKATEEKIERTNELMTKYAVAKQASDTVDLMKRTAEMLRGKMPAPKLGSDPCLRSLRRKLIAAKHADDGSDSFQRVGKLIHGFIKRDPLARIAKIAADRDERLEKAKYKEEQAKTVTEETRKGQPEKPTTAPMEGQPHDGEGREVTFGDGRTVTFKSASERQQWLANKVKEAYKRAGM